MPCAPAGPRVSTSEQNGGPPSPEHAEEKRNEPPGSANAPQNVKKRGLGFLALQMPQNLQERREMSLLALCSCLPFVVKGLFSALLLL